MHATKNSNVFFHLKVCTLQNDTNFLCFSPDMNLILPVEAGGRIAGGEAPTGIALNSQGTFGKQNRCNFYYCDGNNIVIVKYSATDCISSETTS